MATEGFGRTLARLGSLGDPTRRAIYERLASEGREMSRDEVARVTGIARALVAYHLDRLEKDGLIETRFARRSGRTGPGAGRPAKLYSRPKSPVQVSLPPRDYGLAARVLAETAARQPEAGVYPVLSEVARKAGEEEAAGRCAGNGDDAACLAALLSERGYEPLEDSEGATCLRNCIFEPLPDQQRQLVCSMNLALIEGMLRALPDAGVTASLEPAQDRCCVVLRRKNDPKGIEQPSDER